jgi:type IV pilus assembly protein PilA
MKVEMKAKLLQYLLNKNDTGGFTKIGLLVRIFLYSCVAGVVLLPSYIRPCRCYCHNLLLGINCSRQVEGINNIGALNRAQEAYYLERGEFANTIDKVGLGIRTESANYSYHILPNGPVQTSNDPKELAPSFEAVIHIANPKIPNLKGSIGVVWTIEDKVTIEDKEFNQITTREIFCEEAQPSTLVSPRIAPFIPPRSNGEYQYQCPKGWRY